MQMARPVRPAPLPSSKTVLGGRRGPVSETMLGKTGFPALPCTPRSPVSKGGRVLYGPFSEVECSVPRDQAGGAMGNDGCALRERDRVSGRLGQDRERINPATRRQGADFKKKNITTGGWLDKTVEHPPTECYMAMERSRLSLYAPPGWVSRVLTLHKESQSQKATHCVIPSI